MRFKGQIWIAREKPVSFCFFFGLLVDALKFRNLSRDDDDDDIINNEQKFCNIRREDFTSLFSLSLSFNYLVPISAGIARVVKVKLARAQGVHDDVEDTELTGG